MSYGAVVALDICILLRLSGLDVDQSDALFLSLFHQFSADVFRPNIDTNCEWLAAPFDDLVQALDYAFGR